MNILEKKFSVRSERGRNREKKKNKCREINNKIDCLPSACVCVFCVSVVIHVSLYLMSLLAYVRQSIQNFFDCLWFCFLHAVRINKILGNTLGPSTSSISFFIRFSRSAHSEWVYIFGNTHTRARIYAAVDFERWTHKHTPSHEYTARNNYNHRNTIYSNSNSGSSNNNNIDSTAHITSRSAEFFFAFLCLSSSFVHLSLPSLYV